MSNIKDIIDKYNLYSDVYTYKNNTRILDTKEGKVVIKEKKKDKNKIYNYLLSRKFNHFLLCEKEYRDFEVYPYVEEVSVMEDAKAMDLIITLSFLHIKTTFYKENNLDDVKKIYEDTLAEIDYLYKYFLDLQDVIEKREYMSPVEYLLIRNITKLYKSLEFSRNNITLWYEEVTKQKSSRYVLLHGSVCLDHFLVGRDSLSFISWDKARFGMVIYDFLDFFRNEYLNVDTSRLYDVYQSRYKFTREEELLFFARVSIPWKVDIDNSLDGCIKVYEWVEYLEKCNELISKQNQKYEKVTQTE